MGARWQGAAELEQPPSNTLEDGYYSWKPLRLVSAPEQKRRLPGPGMWDEEGEVAKKTRIHGRSRHRYSVRRRKGRRSTHIHTPLPQGRTFDLSSTAR